MKLRDHTVLHFTLVTLLATFVVSAGLGLVLTQQGTDYLIRSHIELYPKVIHALGNHYPAIHDYLSAAPGTEPPPEVRSFFRDLLSLGAVFRLKAWSPDGTILWSDKPEIIGLAYPDNPHLQEARRGRVSYDITPPVHPEQATERGYDRVLEIYTPLYRDARLSGILELYESDQALHAQLARNSRVIWAWVVTSGVVLYGLLFSIFYRSWKRQRQTAAELTQTQDATIFALAFQAELRDMGTGRHLERTGRYVRALATELRGAPQWRDYISANYLENLVKSVPLHDIGKVGIGDAILCKPGPLTAQERRIMEQHPELGARILARAEEKLPFRSFLGLARNIALYHHEHWDGGGYPFGLKGEAVPLSARLMALVDVYDALRSRRHYKDPLPHEVCREYLLEQSGRQFDPRIVEAFVRSEEEFLRISEEIAGEEALVENDPITHPSLLRT